jgi:hypothetical protein
VCFSVSFSTQWLARDFVNLTCLGVFKHRSQLRAERKQVHQAVCFRSQDDYGQRSIADTLLFRETFVHGNEHVEMLCHRIKKRTVIEIRPAYFRRGPNFVPWQLTG